MAKNFLQLPLLSIPSPTGRIPMVENGTDYGTTPSGIAQTILYNWVLTSPFRNITGDLGVLGTANITGGLRNYGNTFLGNAITDIHRISGMVYQSLGTFNNLAAGTTSTFAGHVNISGNTAFGVSNSNTTKCSGSLTVSGPVRTYGSLSVDGGITVTGGFTTTGSLTLGSATARHQIIGPITFSSPITGSSDLTIAGISTFNNRVTVDNYIYCQNIVISGGLEIQNNFSVLNDANVYGNCSVGGDMDVFGSLNAGGGFVCQGHTYLGNLTSHQTYVAGNVFVNSGVGIKGDALITGNTVMGGLTANGLVINLGNNTLGKVYVNRDLFVSDDLFAGTICTSGIATISGNLCVSGNFNLSTLYEKKARFEIVDQPSQCSVNAGSETLMNVNVPGGAAMVGYYSVGDWLQINGCVSDATKTNGVFKIASQGATSVVVTLPVAATPFTATNCRIGIKTKNTTNGVVTGLWSATRVYDSSLPLEQGYCWTFDSAFASNSQAYMFYGDVVAKHPSIVTLRGTGNSAPLGVDAPFFTSNPKATGEVYFNVMPVWQSGAYWGYYGTNKGQYDWATVRLRARIE